MANNIDIEGNVGPASATGQGSVHARDVAGRDQVRTENVNQLLVQIQEEAHSAGERLLASLVFALHEDTRAEIREMREGLYSNGLFNDVRNLQRELQDAMLRLVQHPARCPFLEAVGQQEMAERRRRELVKLAVQVAVAAGVVILSIAAAVIAAKMTAGG